MAGATEVRPGRRERSAREKRGRILAAATALFDERGFDGVTTQEIADRADVAVGTLFRYASTKGELFLMVYNQRLARAIGDGAAAATDEPDPTAAVFRLVEPVLHGARDAVSAATYQRELLFGSADEQYRAQGLALVDDLQRRIAARLEAAAPDPGGQEVRVASRRAARTVFAALNLLLIGARVGLAPNDSPAAELRAQVKQVVQGFLAAVSEPRAVSG